MKELSQSLGRMLATGAVPHIWAGGLWDPEWPRRFALSEVGCGEMLSLTHPEVVVAAHRALLEAGADAVSTNTFSWEDSGREVYEASARLARLAAEEFSTSNFRAFVVGSIGPLLSSLGLSLRDHEVPAPVPAYIGQIRALHLGGADVFHLESCQTILQARTAMLALKSVERELGVQLPMIVTAALQTNGLMLDDATYGDFCREAEPFQPLACGISGPAHTLAEFRKYISPMPTVGFVDAFAHSLGWIQTPRSLASVIVDFVARDNPVIVGVGRGSMPAYIREIAASLGR